MTPLKGVMNEVVPIANDAFVKFRKEAGLTGEFPSLSVAESESADVEFTLNVWKAIAPYEAISRFAEEYVLYGQVSNTGKVYVGTGATNTDRPTDQAEHPAERHQQGHYARRRPLYRLLRRDQRI